MSEPRTPLPWRLREDTLELVDSNGHRLLTPNDPYCDRHSDELEIYGDLKDLRYIAEACNAYPSLTAENEKLRGEVERLTKVEQLYHQVMSQLRRSRQPHGDCKSGKRYAGIPLGCTACLADRELSSLLHSYKGAAALGEPGGTQG